MHNSGNQPPTSPSLTPNILSKTIFFVGGCEHRAKHAVCLGFFFFFGKINRVKLPFQSRLKSKTQTNRQTNKKKKPGG